MVTRIIEFCARNRLLVLFGVAFATIGAVWAIRHVKLDAIPDLSEPQVIVFTEWMGRSPTLIEDQVTYPVVSALLPVPHVTDVRGLSMFGMSFVYVVFEEGTDIYWARSRVLEYLSTLERSLPAGATPVLGPDATGIGWVYQYTLVDRTGRHGLDELRTFQDFTLRYALGAVPGVAEVASVGGYQRQYQVTIDPRRLQAFGVTLPEVTRAIRDSNDDVGGRILELSGREYYVRGLGYIQDLGALERVVVRPSGPQGSPILVRDVGTVRFGPEIRRGLLDWNGEGEAVGGIIVMRYGENAREVIERVEAKLEALRPGFPEGVEVEVAYDRSGIIERSIDTLGRALVEEAIAVALIIILFLLHVRSALLPILSLPVAVALSFIPMYFLDIPSTIMSLGGIAVAIGATVDAEIVMIEASHKKLEGAPPGADREALLAAAAREVTPAIFFSLLIIAVAFLPVFTLTGQAGRLFRPLAYTKTFVMLFSAVLSITFAPALRGLLIRGKIHPEHRHPVSRFIIRLYKPFVYVALRRPKSTLAIGLLAIVSAVPLAAELGHEFMPPLNEGDLLYMPMTLPNVSIEESKRVLQTMDRTLREVPEVASVFGKAGRAESPTDPAPLAMLETTIRLRPKEEWRTKRVERWYSGWAPDWIATALRPLWPEERPISWEELVADIDRRMQVPGYTNAWTMPIKARVDMLTTGIRTPIGIKVFGADLTTIEAVGVALETLLTPIPGTRSVLFERSQGGLYVDIVPNRDEVARYGLTVGDVERTIEAAIGGAPITTTVEGRNRFTVNVRYAPDDRDDIDALRRVLVPVAPGGGGMAPDDGGMGPGGALERSFGPVVLAQTMSTMGGGPDAADDAAPGPPRLPLVELPAGDTGMDGGVVSMPTGAGDGMRALAPSAMSGSAPGSSRLPALRRDAPTFVPLGQLADIRIAAGPPMVRDEDGLLVGYVYVDIDQQKRDIGGYVDEAKSVVDAAIASGRLTIPPGYYLGWTGQYELLVEMVARMKIVIPITLLIIVLLLYVHFRNVVEVLIVLLSIPFALVGSVWLLWALDYRVSTAVWVGVIALVGLAAQTGIVMIVYIDNAYERRRQAGKVRDLNDIIWAHMEGTVMRVRPKLMTVTTMLAGLVPLLWATGTGADVMKRVAAPMVGGLLTSAFLTLEIIPVVYTYWRQEQLLWEHLARLDPRRLRRLRTGATFLAVGWSTAVAAVVVRIYLAYPAGWLLGIGGVAGLLVIGGTADYFAARPAAKRLVWP